MIMVEPDGQKAARKIRDDAERLARDLPALEALLNSFAPVLAEQALLRREAPGWAGPRPALDEQRYVQGLWLLADSGFQPVGGPELSRAAGRLLPVMARAFPGVARELEALGQALENGSLAPEALFPAAMGRDLPAVPGVSAETLRFAASLLVKPFLERQADDLGAILGERKWYRGMCPVCGGAPSFSMLLRQPQDDNEFLRAHGGQRWLRCGTCSTTWRHKRSCCPACDTEEPENLFNFSAEGRDFERADACKKCQTYILCLSTMEMVEIPDPDVAALAMLPLDILARQQGYAPLAATPWNAGA